MDDNRYLLIDSTGALGTSGTSGTSGADGSPGGTGTSGTSATGTSGSSGTSGMGSPGTSGTSGTGSPGTSGTTGTSGKDGGSSGPPTFRIVYSGTTTLTPTDDIIVTSGVTNSIININMISMLTSNQGGYTFDNAGYGSVSFNIYGSELINGYSVFSIQYHNTSITMLPLTGIGWIIQ